MDISSQDAGSPRVILVVDDDPSDLTLMERALSRAGYAVQTASSSQQALSILQKLIPAVLVFDVSMPGMSGFELCATLKDDDRLKNIPVVFVSGFDSAENFKTGHGVGGVFFVPKAKGWTNLLNAVALLCGSQGRSTSRNDSVGAGARFPEKSSAPRYVLIAKVDIIEPITGKRITGLTSDISLTGCQIEVSSSFPQGSLVQIRITRSGQTLETLATIVRVQPQGMGVAFRKTAPDHTAIVTSWIKQLSIEQDTETERVS